MADGQIGRRRVLTHGAALGFFSLVATPASPRNQQHEPSIPFTLGITIEGLPEASKNAVSVAIDPITIDPLEMAPGNTGDVRLMRPGSVSPLGATITCKVGKGGSKELRQWWLDTSRGQQIRKSITINLRVHQQERARTYNLVDCFPVSYSSVNFDTSSTVQTETLTVSVGRIEFK